MATTITAPVICENIWGDEPEQAYYTVRYYNASGIGVEQEWTNVYGSEAQAKDFAQMKYRIAQGNMYRLYAFKQAGRIQ